MKNRNFSRHPGKASAVAVAATLGFGIAAHAADQYWDSNGATAGAGITPAGTWGSDAFWSPDPNGGSATAAWANGNTAIFSAGTDAVAPYAVSVNGTQAAAGITVQEGPLALSGGTLNVAMFDVAPVANTTVTSVLTGGPITKTGAGTLTLGTAQSQPNAFSKIVITGGVVSFPGENVSTEGDPNPIGTVPFSVIGDYVTISNGATLRTTRVSATGTTSFLVASRGITLGAGGGALEIADSSTRLFYNGVIVGTSLTKSGAGCLELHGVGNKYTGNTVISAGILAIDSDAFLGANAGTIRFTGGGMNISATRAPSGGQLPNPLSFEANATFNTYSSATSAKRIIFSTDSISTTPLATVTVRNSAAGGTGTYHLRLTGHGFDFTSPIVLGQAGENNVGLELFNPTGTQTFSGVISGPGIVNRSVSSGTAGDTLFSGANSYTGNTTLNAGSIGFGVSSVVTGNAILSGPVGVGTLTLNSNSNPLGLYAAGGSRVVANPLVLNDSLGSVEFKGSNNLEMSGPVSLSAATIVNVTNTATTTLSGGVSGGASLKKTGPGTLTLTGTNTNTGGITVDGGTLEIRRLQEGNAVTINTGTIRVLESSPNYASGHPSGNNAFVSKPASLTIASNGSPLGSRVYNGKLDLTNNDLIVDYTGVSPILNIEDMVRAGFNGGDFLGNGITTSIGEIDNSFVLAVADNASLAAPFGTANGGTLFSGVDVDLTSVLVKFTHRVDLNLDGVVTASDATLFGTSYDPGQPAVWATGDLDYDGVYTPNDATLFGTFYDPTLASLPEPVGLIPPVLLSIGSFRRRITKSFR